MISYIKQIYLLSYSLFFPSLPRPQYIVYENSKKHKSFIKLYNVLINNKITEMREIVEYLLFSFSRSETPPTFEELMSFTFIETYKQLGKKEGERLRRLYIDKI